MDMEKLVALCRRRGFIFQSSEIYGGINGFWDYGPLGVELKKNIKDAWWHDMVRNPALGPDRQEITMVGVDCAIIMNPKVWEASGHVGGFQDPMQSCRQCRKLYRADQVVTMLKESTWAKSLDEARKSMKDVGELERWVAKKGKTAAPNLLAVREPAGVFNWLKEGFPGATFLNSEISDLCILLGTGKDPHRNYYPVCPNCGGELTEPRQFNLMFQTHYGAVQDS